VDQHGKPSNTFKQSFYNQSHAHIAISRMASGLSKIRNTMTLTFTSLQVPLLWPLRIHWNHCSHSHCHQTHQHTISMLNDQYTISMLNAAPVWCVVCSSAPNPRKAQAMPRRYKGNLGTRLSCTVYHEPPNNPWKNNGFGHLKASVFTVKTSKHVGFGGPWYKKILGVWHYMTWNVWWRVMII